MNSKEHQFHMNSDASAQAVPTYIQSVLRACLFEHMAASGYTGSTRSGDMRGTWREKAPVTWLSTAPICPPLHLAEIAPNFAVDLRGADPRCFPDEERCLLCAVLRPIRAPSGFRHHRCTTQRTHSTQTRRSSDISSMDKAKAKKLSTSFTLSSPLASRRARARPLHACQLT